MSWLDDIVTARDSAAANLKAVLASPRPTYTVGDVTFEFADYTRMLREQVASLTAIIDDQEAVPFEVHSEGVT